MVTLHTIQAAHAVKKFVAEFPNHPFIADVQGDINAKCLAFLNCASIRELANVMEVDRNTWPTNKTTLRKIFAERGELPSLDGIPKGVNPKWYRVTVTYDAPQSTTPAPTAVPMAEDTTDASIKKKAATACQDGYTRQWQWGANNTQEYKLVRRAVASTRSNDENMHPNDGCTDFGGMLGHSELEDESLF